MYILRLPKTTPFSLRNSECTPILCVRPQACRDPCTWDIIQNLERGLLKALSRPLWACKPRSQLAIHSKVHSYCRHATLQPLLISNETAFSSTLDALAGFGEELHIEARKTQVRRNARVPEENVTEWSLLKRSSVYNVGFEYVHDRSSHHSRLASLLCVVFVAATSHRDAERSYQGRQP